MNEIRTGKPQAPEQREDERKLDAAREPRRDERERKPSPIERREWRGSGVCGDRHTD
jgi:hypothetical protein